MEINLVKLQEIGKERFKKYPYTEYMNELRLDDEIYALVGYITQMKLLSDNMVDVIVEMGEHLTAFLNMFDTNLETKVKTVLQEWKRTGFLDVIIDEAFQNQIDSVELVLKDKVDRNEPESITMSMLAQDVKAAISSGEWTFDINTGDIVDGSVTKQKLSNEVNTILDFSKVYTYENFNNAKIFLGRELYYFSQGALYTTAAETINKWVLLNSQYEQIEYVSNNTNTWVVLMGDDEGVSAFAVPLEHTTNLVGDVFNLTKTGSTKVISGYDDYERLKIGDAVRIVKTPNKYEYTFYIKRYGEASFVNWFVVDLTTLVGGKKHHFGFLNGGSKTGKLNSDTKHEKHVPSYEYLETLKKTIDPVESESIIYDIVVWSGQSNADGRGTASLAPVVPLGQGFEFRAYSNPTRLYSITEPFGLNENNPNGLTDNKKTGSPVSAFAISYYETTGRIPVIVSATQGGTAISQWQPEGVLLNDLINRFKTCENWLLTNDYNVGTKSLVWLQGESDGERGTTKEEYKTAFTDILTELKSNGVENVFMLRIGNNRDNSTLYDEIISAQNELAKETKNLIMISTKAVEFAEQGLMKDSQHFNQTACNILGTDGGVNSGFYINTKKEPTMYDPKNNNLYYSKK